MRWSKLTATCLATASIVVVAWPVGAAAATPRLQQEIVTTQHSIRLGSSELAYMARAGTLPIRHNETGEVRANVFFVSYSVEGADGEPPRPLTFAWNGGPGSNAGLLHVMGVGPRRLAMGDVYPDPGWSDMGSMVDNEGTWLASTDLVFVDPVGTGYSRPTREEYGPLFYDTQGDVSSLAEFIRVYLLRFDAWDAPLVLAGESYGALRAASVARALQAGGIRVAGLVLISGSAGLGPLPEHLAAPLLLPTHTAVAAYHGKLGRDVDADRAMRRARTWAMGPYAEALSRSQELTRAEHDAIRRTLSQHTGIPVDALPTDALTISGPRFSELLLHDEGRVLGRYDARLHRARKADESLFDPREDASLAPLENHVSGNAPTMMRYLRDTLGYRSDLFYVGPFGGAWPPPERFRGDWMSVRWNFREAPEAPLLDVLYADPGVRVLHASGKYDLVTPAGSPAHQIEELPAGLRERVTVRVYEGGHSFYLDRASRVSFMHDGAALMNAIARAVGPSNY